MNFKMVIVFGTSYEFQAVIVNVRVQGSIKKFHEYYALIEISVY